VTGQPAGLVHGMGKELVEPDWPPLTDGEASAVLARFPGLASTGTAATVVGWRSPRPMSAAALVRLGGGEVFVKRHHWRVRSAAQLAAEHAFAGYLSEHGIPAPAVRPAVDGRTCVRLGDFIYEVHEVAAGADVYREAMSWTPFRYPGHARAAGAMLARLHLAAAGFARPARPPAVLMNSAAVITAADPLAAVAAIAARRPGLARYLAGRAWRAELARDLLPAIGRAAPRLAALPPQWGHGDWHPSNLTWDGTGPGARVAMVLDFGLANRTFAVHDLATALERSAFGWLDLADSGRASADLAAIDALLEGYQSIRPLTPAEAAALPEVLPVAHVEYALSEAEYFADVVRAPALADLAYDSYLLGHARWFATPGGRAALGHLRDRLAGSAVTI
jgi:Ser/Thr protein kinase RdoA (MazF antagonist)